MSLKFQSGDEVAQHSITNEFGRHADAKRPAERNRSFKLNTDKARQARTEGNSVSASASFQNRRETAGTSLDYARPVYF